MSGKLTARQQRFVQLYVVDLNATKAYREAYGAGQAVAEASSSRLLRDVKVQTAIQSLLKPAAEKAELNAEWVLAELRDTVAAAKDDKSHSARTAALGLIGKHLGMFPERALAADPAAQPVESLRTRREELRRRLKLA